ncbi:hypothetical protein LTR85_006143 [Meristemomyces frigidus]|nr:hypothetical protein LTR85_006143 [Meristemomyces frigidus]
MPYIALLPFATSILASNTDPLPWDTGRQATGLDQWLRRSESSSNSSTPTQGWTSQPNGRGTIDIIWSCVFTIFLCSWSVLCVNVPAKTDKQWTILWRRLYLTGLGVLAPEVILQAALGQRLSAARSVKAFSVSAEGLGTSARAAWTLNHGFFADMGGFVLHTSDGSQFPINAKQLHYLVTKSYIALPAITKEDIQDKNKVDPLLRVITVAQILWFVLSCIARVAQNLAVTTFELTTIGFIFCTLGTHICWAHKPADVNVPVMLHCDTPMTQIRREAGLPGAAPPKDLTPLDFVSREAWVWSAWWLFALKALRSVTGIDFHQDSRPISRMPNDDWPCLPPLAIVGVGFFDMTYAAIYVSGWNLWFQTDTERILWRVSTTVILAAFAAFLLLYALLSALPCLRRTLAAVRGRACASRRKLAAHISRRTGGVQTHRSADAVATAKQSFHLPVPVAVCFTAVAFVYMLARAYILLECCLVLRQLPATAYETVDWAGLLPHV